MLRVLYSKETKLLSQAYRIQVRAEVGHRIYLLEAVCFFIPATSATAMEAVEVFEVLEV